MKELEELIQKYKRRCRALNTTVKKLNDKDSKETSFYCGRRDELEKVIDELNELLIVDDKK